MRIGLFTCIICFLAVSCGTSETENVDHPTSVGTASEEVQVLSAEQLVRRFNTAFSDRNLGMLEGCLKSDFILIDYAGDTVIHSREEYLRDVIGWNVEFGTTWTMEELEVKGSGLVTTVEVDDDEFFRFLYGGPIKYRYNYHVSDSKIYKIKYDSLPGFHQFLTHGSNQYTIFFAWLANNHPEEIKLFQGESDIPPKEMKRLVNLYQARGDSIPE